MSERTSVRPTWSLPRVSAEVSLVLVHVAVIVGFSRLYSGTSYAGPLLGFVLCSHAVAIAGRRWSIPTPALACVALVVTVLVATWTLFPSTTAYGLPTRHSWHEAIEALRLARARFSDVVAPVAPLPGFQLGAGLALAASVWFADWTAFRLRISIEAIAPAGVLFVFASVLGSGEHQRSSTVIFLGSALAFVAAQRAVRAQAYQAWLSDAPTAGPRALVRAGAAVGVIAVLAGTVIGPRVPGAHADAVVDWRNTSGDQRSRVTVSPMVELRKRLVDQSSTEVFTVRANRPAYWRLTSLDRFDGQIWSSSGTFSSAGEKLATDDPTVAKSRIITQRIRIEALASIWVPVAFEARGVTDSSQDLRWDERSGTLIVDSDSPTSDGVEYTVVSEVPELRASELRRASGIDPREIRTRYLGLPADFPGLASGTARSITRTSTNRYDQVRALQDWFRTSFRYSLAVNAGHSDDALVSFLRDREGYCEQFAGAFAAMARSLGIPARVAVGFTPGLADTAKNDTYHVLGKHAHAWPEVYFPKIGWVPFEPTPGRGIPDGEQHTGVPAAQDESPTPTTLPSIVTSVPSQTSGSIGSGVTSETRPPHQAPTAGVRTGSGDQDGGSWMTTAVTVGIVVLAVAGAWLAVLLVVPAARRRRRRSAQARHASSDQVLDAWAGVMEPVRWATGQRPTPAETHREFAGRIGDALGALATPLRQLADLVSEASWSPAAMGPAEVALADRLAAEVQAGLAGTDTRWERFRRRISWHEAFDRPR